MTHPQAKKFDNVPCQAGAFPRVVAKGRAMRNSYTMCAGAVRLMAVLLIPAAVLETACVSYTETVRSGQATVEERPVGQPLFSVAAIERSQPDTLLIRLTRGNCQTLVHDPVTDTTYRRPSRGASWAMIGLGAAVAALGTYVWFAPESPPNCLMLNNSCAGRNTARTYAGIFWGIGGAGIGLGIERLFQPPTVERTRDREVVSRADMPDHRCGGSMEGIPIQFDYAAGQATARTDGSGTVAFHINADGVGYLDKGSVYIMNDLGQRQTAVGTVAMDRFSFTDENGRPVGPMSDTQRRLCAALYCLPPEMTDKLAQYCANPDDCPFVNNCLNQDQLTALNRSLIHNVAGLFQQSTNKIASILGYAGEAALIGACVERWSSTGSIGFVDSL